MIEVKFLDVPDPVPGRELGRVRASLGLDLATAARALCLSVLALHLLESGKAEMAAPAMWPAARLVLAQAAAKQKEKTDGTR